MRFNDNIQVARLGWGYEYLGISFHDPEGDSQSAPVYLNRYCVPGRCDTYSFDWIDMGQGYGDRIRYFADGNAPLTKSLAMLAKDLDKKQVVKMIREARERPENLRLSKIFTERLLASIAPKSKALREARRAIDRRMKTVRATKLALTRRENNES